MTRMPLVCCFAVVMLLGGSGGAMAQGPIRAVVSIPPQQEILQRLGGQQVSVTVLIPPGRSPATFEPSPRQMASVSDADLLLPLNLPFERTVVARIRHIEPDLPVCDASPVISMGNAGRSDSEVHDHSRGLDPHFWLDPRLTIEYASGVTQCLCRVRPESCDVFRTNLEDYSVALDAVDARIAERLAPFSGRSFWVFHPALGYFAERYGLLQVAIEREGKNPTGRSLAEVIEGAREQGVRIIFVQRNFADSAARAVAEAVGADLVELDPLAPDLLANLDRIADLVVGSFDVERGSTP